MKNVFISINILLCNLFSWSQSSLPGSGNAVRFDGIDDEINFPQQKVAYDNFTMEAWVYPTGATHIFGAEMESSDGIDGFFAQQYLIFPSHGSQFEDAGTMAGAGFTVGVDGIVVSEFNFYYAPPLLLWRGTISGWTHIAVVYNNRQPSLYVNGELVRTGLQSQKARVYASNSFIGGGSWIDPPMEDLGNPHFSGNADEIRIWNIALTQSQIQERMHKKITSSDALFSKLVNYYNLDETSGNVVLDAGTAAVSGQLINGAERIKSGAPISDNASVCCTTCGNAVSFDGVDDAINTPQQKITKNNFTIEAWVNPTTTTDVNGQQTSGVFGALGTNRYLISPTYGAEFGDPSSNAGAGLTVGTNGVCVFEYASDYFPALLSWNGSITGWTHVAVVYNNKRPSLYINGVFVKTGYQSLMPNIYPSNGLIGGFTYGHYQGAADEIRIWNIPLTQSQIQARMHYRITSSDALFGNLENYYKLDETSGDIVYDAGKTGISGLLINGSVRTACGAPISDLCCTTCGKAVRFDGINDEINSAQQKIAYDNFTMEAWVRPTDVTALGEESTSGLFGSEATHQYLMFPTYGGEFENVDIMAGAGFTVGINGIGVFEHSGFYAPQLLAWHGNVQEWTHVAVVYNNRQPRLFINGELVRTGLQSFRSRVYASNKQIGGGFWGHFRGGADEIRIWNIPLTQVQIQERMHKRIQSSDVLFSNLVNYYKLDEASGNVVYDYGIARDSGHLIKGAHRITCAAPLSDAGEYCNASGTSCTKGFIQNVFACYGFNNSTRWNGYSDFSEKSVTSAAGKVIGFSVTPGYVLDSYHPAMYIKVWIDWNGDGDFSDYGETVVCPSTPINIKTKYWVRVPAGTAPGIKRMRVALRSDRSPSSCGTFTYGEVEDYTVKIVAARPGIYDATEDAFDIAGNTFMVYPNPVTNRMMIERSGYDETMANNSPAQMILTDVNGKVLMKATLASLVQVFDMSNIAKGIYFVTIITNNNTSTNKIIINH